MSSARVNVEHLGLWISAVGVFATFVFGWLRWRRDVTRDVAAELRECERERNRLREENVELMRRLLRGGTGSDD